MATLYQRGEAWKLQYTDADGERRTVTLGAVPKRAAESATGFIDKLIDAKLVGGTPAREVSVWLAGLGDVLHERLARVGLCEPRHAVALKSFAEAYVATRGDWSDAARVQFQLGVANAVAFFGADRKLASITPADADAFRAHLAGRLKPATVRKRVRFVKHLLRQAVRSRALAENPFADQKTANVTDRERLQYVPAADALAVADELTGEVRLVFLLARFAGLRTPTETYALTWAGVDFERGTLRVFASKTGRSRTVPIMAELRADLLAAFTNAPDGAERVIGHARKLPVIRRAVESAIVRAGVKPWPKTFQQLRASFATDCVRKLPANAAAAVLGHSRAVAAEHYWTADETDFAALQNALQQAPESGGAGGNAESPKCRNTREILHDVALDGTSRNATMGVTGLEPVASSV